MCLSKKKKKKKSKGPATTLTKSKEKKTIQSYKLTSVSLKNPQEVSSLTGYTLFRTTYLYVYWIDNRAFHQV